MRIFKKLKNRFFYQRSPGEVPLNIIARYLPAHPIVIEAGAHIGVDSIKIAKRWPGATIFAFEPVPNVFAQLKKHTRQYKNIKPLPLALGRITGKAEIYISGGRSDGSSSLLRPKEHLTLHPDVTFGKELEVEVISLDSWAAKQRIKKVDFLWLDLQGYELEALKGAEKSLKAVSAIHTEVNLVEVYEGAPLYEDLRKWLKRRGFRVAFEAIDWDDGGNVLFVKKQD